MADSWYIRLLKKFSGEKDPTNRAKLKRGSLFLKYGPGMITCRQFDQFLAGYLNGDLTKNQLRTFENHIALCPMCRAHFETYIASYQLHQRTYGDAENALPDDVPEDLVTAVLEARAVAKPH